MDEQTATHGATTRDELAALAGAIPEPMTGAIDAWVAAKAALARPVVEGDAAPDFELPDAFGNPVRLSDRLARGPVVLTFYRGDWCPFCNIQLRALQQAVAPFQDAGVSLLAVSPQAPDRAMALAEREQLTFDVLSDEGQDVIAAYGLRVAIDGDLRGIYEGISLDLGAQNADGSWYLPIPATYVVDRSGRIVAAHVDADYRTRMDIDDIVAALTSLTEGSTR